MASVFMKRVLMIKESVINSEAASIAKWQKKIADKFEPRPQYLIPVLQYVQNEEGYLQPEAMSAAAKHLRVSESTVYGVASFYAQFHFEPRGKHIITVCRGTACHVRGSAGILKDIEKKLSIRAGETTKDLKYSIETVACFGSCALAPVVVADAKVHGRQTSASAGRLVDQLGSNTSAGAPSMKQKARKAGKRNGR
jgi:NADH-quinone oxidoreductase subunit E